MEDSENNKNQDQEPELNLNDLMPYERKQIEEIEKWKKEEPGVVNKAIGILTYPLTWLISKIIPDSAMRGALKISNHIAEWFSDKESILESASITRIEELKEKDLDFCDQLANGTIDRAKAFAAIEGCATGATGLPGILVDIPTLITFGIRTIHKIGLCYGFEANSEDERNYILCILSAGSANSVKEKEAAILTLNQIRVILLKNTWKKIIDIAAKNSASLEALIVLIKNLLKQLGINLTKKKALAAIPIIGAIVGGTSNVWFITEISVAAKRSFQERWIMEKYSQKPDQT